MLNSDIYSSLLLITHPFILLPLGTYLLAKISVGMWIIYLNWTIRKSWILQSLKYPRPIKVHIIYSILYMYIYISIDLSSHSISYFVSFISLRTVRALIESLRYNQWFDTLTINTGVLKLPPDIVTATADMLRENECISQINITGKKTMRNIYIYPSINPTNKQTINLINQSIVWLSVYNILTYLLLLLLLLLGVSVNTPFLTIGKDLANNNLISRYSINQSINPSIFPSFLTLL